MRRLPPKYDPKPTQSEGETSAPLIADHRNFYKVEKWMKDGSKVTLCVVGNSSEGRLPTSIARTEPGRRVPPSSR